MSALHEIWKWAHDHEDDPGCLEGSVRDELRVAAALVLICRHRLRQPASPVVYCSDSSGAGYALHVGRFDRHLVRESTRWKERWRFQAFESFGESDDDVSCCSPTSLLASLGVPRPELRAGARLRRGGS